ncbi:uncharacterized protein B0H64DRAFT_247732 [Chaetomium fimeti]|uniref:Uncharacterized protein n=1 Tax=Chaetomium fimeti TaxID=1854472 RepID=A0AAE0H7R7_9PEZI|nr:hypothetical protein B0H64DRAFT_247732 [Chaetomium fimeti]
MVIALRHNLDEDSPNSSIAQRPVSIKRIIALHPRERLFVQPLLWTNRQLALLGCRIHVRDEASCGSGLGVVPRDWPAPKNGNRVDGKLLSLLTRLRKRQPIADELEDTVRRLLRLASGSVLLKPNRVASLEFEGRSCASFPYCRITAGNATFALFDAHDIAQERYRLFKPPPTKFAAMDLPGVQRCNRLLKRYMPTEHEKDPYLVAFVIALAQQSRRHMMQQEPALSAVTVRILFSSKRSPISFNTFVAHVPVTFLHKLDTPAQEPPLGSDLDIHHCRVSLEPFENLPHRLLHCLARDYAEKTRGQNE